MQKIELLAPAGSPEALDAAIGEGADAVYLGLKNFNARMRSTNFAYSQFEAALRSLRRMGKKLYVTVNTVFEQREADRMYQLLKYLDALGPDALIVQDFGVVAMSRSCFPSLKLHASTQMNIASARGVNALSRHGLSRVVLARELSLVELQAIRAETNMELEAFVHGALCVSASGLCLFSSFLGGKSANRGMCTQACRRLYNSGEEVGEGEKGYYFSPCDLQLLERVGELAAAGINAFKIEGRMKSADYVGTVVSAYRLALDALAEEDEEKLRQGIRKGQEILLNDFARAKTEYHFSDKNPLPSARQAADWLSPEQDGGTGISLGSILKVKNSGDKKLALVQLADTANVPCAGDSIRLHRSDDSERTSHKLTFVEPPAGSGGCWFSIPEGFHPGDRVYLIQTKAMHKRYAPVIPHNAKGRGREPGRDKAPLPKFFQDEETDTSGKKTSSKKNAKSNAFPEGLYVAVSRVEDLYVIQSVRPERAMLGLNQKTSAYLLSDNKPPLPFKPSELILVLDPYFPQALAETMADEIGQLVELGFSQFVLNNPGHFSLFRAFKDTKLIAGPWLYMFNSWSLSFVSSWDVDGLVSPLENNRQNLERTLGQNRKARAMFFIPVFAWPPLFHIRSDLGKVYDFKTFSDSRGEHFSLVAGADGSTVIPNSPFSITDKIPFLREAGFKRFIIDLSGAGLKKGDYRDLMRAVSEGTPLPRVSRFNWKDGFFQSEA
ncbi:MAG: U32 family peptidase [Treponema sp.]|nr:U32 family peptidase [Treponema sp.]